MTKIDCLPLDFFPTTTGYSLTKEELISILKEKFPNAVGFTEMAEDDFIVSVDEGHQRT